MPFETNYDCEFECLTSQIAPQIRILKNAKHAENATQKIHNTNNQTKKLSMILRRRCCCCPASLLVNLFVATSMIRGMASLSAKSSSSTSTTKRGALIWLHGLGDTPAGWSGTISSVLPNLQPRLADLEYVFPAAPIIPISINGGAKMPGHFDLYDWPVGVGDQEDAVGMLRAVDALEEVATDLENNRGIPRNRIVVGGFSQGGAVAILAAYHSSTHRPARRPFAACVNLSGWLTMTTAKVQPPTDWVHTAETPLFWGHGRYDDKVLYEQQAFGIQKLQEAGLERLEFDNYPVGHESHPEELNAVAKFLDETLFGSKEQESSSEL